MQQFPGRTLEELDGVDIIRLFRVNEAGRIVDVERRRALMLEGKAELSNDEWRMVRRHDRLMAEAEDNGDSA